MSEQIIEGILLHKQEKKFKENLTKKYIFEQLAESNKRLHASKKRKKKLDSEINAIKKLKIKD